MLCLPEDLSHTISISKTSTLKWRREGTDIYYNHNVFLPPYQLRFSLFEEDKVVRLAKSRNAFVRGKIVCEMCDLVNSYDSFTIRC